MQVAAHTYAFRDRPLADALDAIASLGFELVELWHGHATAGSRAARSALDRRGLSAAAVGAGGFYSADPTCPEAIFELARALGAPTVVGCLAPLHAGAIAARLPRGRAFCVENHWDQPLAVPGEVIRLLAAVPRLAACLDTGHSLLAGVAPERFAAALGPRLQHVHLKEGRAPGRVERVLGRRARRRLLARPEPVFPGRGVLDVARFVDALQRLSFTGTISLEHEGDDPEAALAQLRDRVCAAGLRIGRGELPDGARELPGPRADGR